jgi:magnesium chelatase family protein
MPSQILRYQQKLSGPILDRIDLYSDVHEVKHDRLLSQGTDTEADVAVRKRIMQARSIQAKRYGQANKLNADMNNRDIKQFANIDADAADLLLKAAQRLNISARSYMRTIKIARTIADLESSKTISTAHIAEALAYRRPVQDT